MPVQTLVRSAFTVSGVACRHCAQAVGDDVGAIPGVSTVDVELATGAVSITADHPIAADEIAAALRDTGFVLAG